MLASSPQALSTLPQCAGCYSPRPEPDPSLLSGQSVAGGPEGLRLCTSLLHRKQSQIALDKVGMPGPSGTWAICRQEGPGKGAGALPPTTTPTQHPQGGSTSRCTVAARGTGCAVPTPPHVDSPHASVPLRQAHLNKPVPLGTLWP